MTATWEIREGDCTALMAAMDEASVDAIVCDPPYGIGFMGKEWDGRAIAEAAARDRERRASLGPASASRPGRAEPRSSSAFGNAAVIAGPVRGGQAFQAWCEAWAREALRVLKPGGHLLAFGGTRTYHRLACALEDAGFAIRDSVGCAWVYGSGFPKSLDVSKAIDAKLGADRTRVVGEGRNWGASRIDEGKSAYGDYAGAWRITEPATAAAAAAAGLGTALKPAWEPIALARKPLAGTVAENWLTHGTGALNIDGCRIDGVKPVMERTETIVAAKSMAGESTGARSTGDWTAEGRWPANVVLIHHPDCEPTGTRRVRSDGHYPAQRGLGGLGTSGHAGQDDLDERSTDGEMVETWDCAPGCPVRQLDEQSGVLTSGSGPLRRSADKFGRNTYGEFKGTDEVLPPGDSGGASRFFYCAKASPAERGPDNDHPTVKPVELMRWLLRLVTPPGGLVLDPFAGSGTTGIAAMREGFSFIGLEREPDYCELARQRIRDDAPLLNTPAEVAA